MRKPLEFLDHPVPFPGSPTYRAFCRHVVDGDTVDLLVDVGLFQYAYVTVRLTVDAPELYSRDPIMRDRGIAAQQYLRSLLHNRQCLIQTRKDVQTFGRFVAEIFVYEETRVISIADALVDAGHAIRRGTT